MRKTLTLALAALCLAACAGTTTLAVVEVQLTTAEQAAAAYVRLPLCPVSDGTLCSDAGVSAHIRTSDMAAYDAVIAARMGASLAVAQAAISTLADLVPAAK